jgi:predicted nucleic acid-binding protein
VNKSVILDTGPLVAFMDRAELHHAWACDQFRHFSLPLLTCEAVLTEALFLLRRMPPAQDKLLELVARQSLQPVFRLQDEIETIRRMHAKYQNLPMSLADACLVCMADSTGLPICTLDSDFTLYRKRGGTPLPLIFPAR